MIKVRKIKFIGIGFALLFAANLSADHLAEHTVEERIKPSGKVYVEGDDVPVSKPAVVETVASIARSGQEIYEASCAMCHATPAMGAPVFGNAESWGSKLAKGEETLINNAINGINGMPPMGTCASCSEEDMATTVKYMIENSK